MERPAQKSERNLVATYNGLPDPLSAKYGYLAGEGTFWGSPNSNNAATTLLTKSGVSLSAVNAAKGQL